MAVSITYFSDSRNFVSEETNAGSSSIINIFINQFSKACNVIAKFRKKIGISLILLNVSYLCSYLFTPIFSNFNIPKR